MIKYQIISTISESEKNKVYLAAADGIEGPAVLKKISNTDSYKVYQQIKKLSDKHLPKVYDCEIVGEQLLVLEEYIAGETIKERCRKKPLEPAEIDEVFRQLCDAVKVLHSCKPPVIHRDIKPSNMIMTEEGVLKLIDFDVSREFQGHRSYDTIQLGTVEYAPPEQFGYSQTDERSDIYAMGAVLYEIAYGRQYSKKKIDESVPGMDAKHSDKIREIINRCTMFDPEYRFQSVEELSKGYVENKVNRKRMMSGLLIAGLAVVMILGVILYLNTRHKPEDMENTNNLSVNSQYENNNSEPITTNVETVSVQVSENEPSDINETNEENSDTNNEVANNNDVLANEAERHYGECIILDDDSVIMPEKGDGTFNETGYAFATVIGIKYCPDYVPAILNEARKNGNLDIPEVRSAEFFDKSDSAQEEALFYTTFFSDYELKRVVLSNMTDEDKHIYSNINFSLEDGLCIIDRESLENMPEGIYLVEFVLRDPESTYKFLFQDILVISDKELEGYEKTMSVNSAFYEYSENENVSYRNYLRNLCGREITAVYLGNRRLEEPEYRISHSGSVVDIDREPIDNYIENRQMVKIKYKISDGEEGFVIISK